MTLLDEEYRCFKNNERRSKYVKQIVFDQNIFVFATLCLLLDVGCLLFEVNLDTYHQITLHAGKIYNILWSFKV